MTGIIAGGATIEQAVPAIRTQTVRVNVANLAFLQHHRDAVVRFMRAYDKSLHWAFSGDPTVIDDFAAGMAVSHELAAEAAKYYSIGAMQPYEVKGLDRTIADAVQFKRLPRPTKPKELNGLFDIAWHPGS